MTNRRILTGFPHGVFLACIEAVETVGGQHELGREKVLLRSSRVRSLGASARPRLSPFPPLRTPATQARVFPGVWPHPRCISSKSALSQSFLVYNNFLPQLTQNPNEELSNTYALVINRSGSFFHEMLTCMTFRTFIFEVISITTFQRKHVLFTRLSCESFNVCRVLISRGVGIHFPRNMLLDNCYFFLNRK